MRTIIVINDNSNQAMHAAKVALYMAQKNNANILLANIVKAAKINTVTSQTAGNSQDIDEEEPAIDLAAHLLSLNAPESKFKPAIDNLDAYGLSESELAEHINKNNTWMLVQGCGENSTAYDARLLNCYALLDKIKCPLLFVPETFKATNFERIVYMADLRYCQARVMRFLTGFAKKYHANVLFAHLSASGLPDMQQEYACSLFKETVGSHLSYDKVSFSNIREKNTERALDVLINGMHTELIALVNHQFHFKDAFGKFVLQKTPPQIEVPLLVFPF